MDKQISILIVDDHAMVRSMLRDRLDAEPDFTVTGMASSADDAVTLASRVKPDVVLMDIDMPGLLCFEAARMLARQCPDARIIFLSAFFHDCYIEQALAVKAWGYVTKNQPDDSLVTAIRNVAGGVAHFSPEIQARIIVDEQGPKLAQQTRSRLSTLTPRESDVLRYLARGLSKKEIAQTMHISVNTVNRHTSSLMNKLDIHDRVELARFAIREGLADA